jgi:hypothetical protein
VTRLASLLSDPRWFVRRRARGCSDGSRHGDAVPLAQPLCDRRIWVARQAVAALGVIQIPPRRALSTPSSAPYRRVVGQSSGASRGRIRASCRCWCGFSGRPAAGRDHTSCSNTRGAQDRRHRRSDPALLATARRRKFLGGRKLRALKDRSVDALARLGTAKSKDALKEAAAQGDGYLRKIAGAKL